MAVTGGRDSPFFLQEGPQRNGNVFQDVVRVTSREMEILVSRGWTYGVYRLNRHLVDAVARSGVENGEVCVYCTHTTCGILDQEDERGILLDLIRVLTDEDSYLRKLIDILGRLIPVDRVYMHNLVDDRGNARAHIARTLVTRTSVSLPVVCGKVDLGKYLSLILFDCDPVGREREVTILVR